MSEPRHCDEYIDDESAPKCLRDFLEHARSPATVKLAREVWPTLFAQYKGERYRVVMASRFGDVGITRNLKDQHGYALRVFICELSDFSKSAQTTRSHP